MNSWHCETCLRVFLESQGPVKDTCVCGGTLRRGVRPPEPPGIKVISQGGWVGRGDAFLTVERRKDSEFWSICLRGMTDAKGGGQMITGTRDTMIAISHAIETAVKS